MIFSLIAVTITFTALVIWVYRPSQRSRFEDLGKLVFDTDPADQTVKEALNKQNLKAGNPR